MQSSSAWRVYNPAVPIWARLITGVAALRVAVALILYLSGQSAITAASPVPSVAYVGLALAFGGLGVILVVANRNDRRAAWLGGSFVLIATTLSRQFLNIDGNRDLLAPLATLRLDAFLPAFLWHFVGVFPVALTGRRDGFTLGIALATVFWAVTVPVHISFMFAPLDIDIPDWRVLLLGVGRLPSGQGISLYWPLVLGLSGAAFAYLAWRARQARGDERRRVSIFVNGLLGGAAPFVVEVVLEGVIPPYQALVHSPAVEPWVGLALFGGLSTVPFSTAYSVFFDHVVELGVVLRSALQYALARYTIVAVTAIPFGALAVFVVQHRAEPLVSLLSGWRPLLLAALTSFGLVALRARSQWLRALDRRFFRETYDTRQALDHLLIDARNAVDAVDLELRLHNAIDRILHAPVMLYVLDDRDGMLRRPATGTDPVSSSGILVSLAIADRAPMAIDQHDAGSPFRRLPPDEQQWITRGGVHLLLAMAAADGRAIGLLAVGGKQSGLAFTASERRLIEAIGASASLALDNLRLRASSEPLSEPAARECPNCASVSRADTTTCRCGGILVTASAPYVLRGVFRLDRRIGAGGMGVVYHAVDLNLDRSVAVKTLPRVTPDHVERLRREARAMAAITHPNLAVVHGLETWQGIPFLIEEYLGGGTLSHRLARGPLPIADALDMAVALADALACLHAADILHCDIKPSNIAFSNQGTPKLLDFGVAKLRRGAADTTVTWGRSPEVTAAPPPSTNLQAFGTPAYMSPEALRRDPPSALFDLWSLAVVVFESVAGTRPGLVVGPTDLLRHSPGAPATVAAFLSEALAPNPGQRPASAAAFSTRLRRLRAELQLG